MNSPRSQDFTIPTGTGVVIGSPKNALPEPIVNAIARMTATFPEVIEAHLPQVFVDKTMAAPAQVLVLVLSDLSIANTVMSKIGPQVGTLLAPGLRLDIWPLPANSPLLVAVRRAACQLCRHGTVNIEDRAYRVPKKWWQLWR